MRKLFAAVSEVIAVPTIVLLVHVTLSSIFDIYRIAPWFDIPMHFAGGASIGAAGFLLIEKHVAVASKLHNLFKVFVIAAITALAATLWEFFEFTLDYYFQLYMQVSMNDTMLDMFLGLLGGLLVGLWLVYTNSNKAK